MSLNITFKADTNDELLELNIKPSSGFDWHFVPGQTISYSFLTAGETAIFNAYAAAYSENISNAGALWGTTTWNDDVRTAIRAAEEIINLNFTETADIANSDLRWVNSHDNTGSSVVGYSFLTPSFDMDAQGDGDDAGILIYDKDPFHTGVRAEAETGGGNTRTETMIHEFGHFLGLSHPHTGSFTSTAPFKELNDSKYDVMSYEYSDSDRKVVVSGGTINSAFNFGTFVNFAPINIAALQYLYGANTTTHTGNNTYTLTDAGTTALDVDGSDNNISIGRAYYTVWDNGGTDQIVYNGANRALLNLNAATLNRTSNDADLTETLSRVADSDYYGTLYSNYRSEITDSKYYAGGFFSQILTNDDSASFSTNFNGKYANTLGGYAIANGVTVENASGGSNNDLIIGNAANNILNGNGGNDTIFDGNGNDTVNGGAGNDIFYVGKGTDTFNGDANNDIGDLFTPFTRFNITNNAGQITITDIVDNKYGTNTFNDVESFNFAGSNFTVADLPTGNEYEREYADELHNDFLLDFALNGGVGYDFA